MTAFETIRFKTGNGVDWWDQSEAVPREDDADEESARLEWLVAVDVQQRQGQRIDGQIKHWAFY